MVKTVRLGSSEGFLLELTLLIGRKKLASFGVKAGSLLAACWL